MDQSLSLHEYQNLSRQNAIYKDQRTVNGLTYTVLALCGEAGELANKLKKHLRVGSTPDVAVLADELGDCLWYVAAVAHELGLGLEEVAIGNIEKLTARRAEGKVTG